MAIDKNNHAIPIGVLLFSAKQSANAKGMGTNEVGEEFEVMVGSTDNDPRERSGLNKTWSLILLLLCIFHVWQAWRNGLIKHVVYPKEKSEIVVYEEAITEYNAGSYPAAKNDVPEKSDRVMRDVTSDESWGRPPEVAGTTPYWLDASPVLIAFPSRAPPPRMPNVQSRVVSASSSGPPQYSFAQIRAKSIEHLGYQPCLWQIRVVEAILKRDGDVVCISATGSGKTLTFWLPLLFKTDGIQLVISPLNILGDQNVTQLSKMGIDGISITAETINLN
ncbi:hypothetical protein B0H16DRAFT_1842673 [Mycena metata]|uniref:DEAD/DEAH-box helicase domain-containing protein n=1 Tax=Mycena metata TaxID=1033252 RepID=A0AAD7N8S1_9AGAR|nr:hypothetical protein B0H16DRAFT_1842673 [Mycena metata]